MVKAKDANRTDMPGVCLRLQDYYTRVLDLQEGPEEGHRAQFD